MALGKLSPMLTLIAFLVTLTAASSHAAQSKPATLVELALYQGADREKILLDGAKQEGQITFYTSNTCENSHCPMQAAVQIQTPL